MTSAPNSNFDDYADNYDDALSRGISVSGEDKDYFAKGRVAWLAGCLHELGEQPKRVVDLGCGTGSTTPYLRDRLGAESVLGLDTSLRSLDAASRAYGGDRITFAHVDQYQPNQEIDLVFCNGVFHHIPPDKRAATLRYIDRALRPGGLFALWENNPLNPGTRIVMSRIPFDRDAITLTASEAQRLVRSVGLQVVSTNYLFIFPRALRWLRPLEPMATRLPLGAQYQVLCRRPL